MFKGAHILSNLPKNIIRPQPEKEQLYNLLYIIILKVYCFWFSDAAACTVNLPMFDLRRKQGWIVQIMNTNICFRFSLIKRKWNMESQSMKIGKNIGKKADVRDSTTHLDLYVFELLRVHIVKNIIWIVLYISFFILAFCQNVL